MEDKRGVKAIIISGTGEKVNDNGHDRVDHDQDCHHNSAVADTNDMQMTTSRATAKGNDDDD